MYKYKGPLVAFAAFANHCSLYVISKTVLTVFADELQSYKTAGTTIQFVPDMPLPAGLVQKIVKLRIKQNEERTAEKKPASRTRGDNLKRAAKPGGDKDRSRNRSSQNRPSRPIAVRSRSR